MKYKYIMFDFDNTTVDSLDYWHYVQFNEAFRHYGMKPNKSVKNLMMNLDNDAKAQKFIDVTGLNAEVKDVRGFWDKRMEYYYCNKIKMLAGVKEFLTYLKGKGYKILLVTASELDVIKVAIKHFGLDAFYDGIVTETEIGYPKSDVRFFKTLVKKLKVDANDLFFFEDFAKSVKNATETGIDCIWVMHKLNKHHKTEMKTRTKAVIKNFKSKKIYTYFD